MGRTAVAFSPGHISGYFFRVETGDPLTTGSMGAGLVIDQGVVARVCAADRTSVRVRSMDGSGSMVAEMQGSRVVEEAMSFLGLRAEVTTESPLPSGCGFGCSAAAILAAITAADACFGLGLDPIAIARYAHRIEIAHRTGLGDVAAAMGGGLECRREPGVDAAVERVLPIDTPLSAVALSPLSTAEVLASPAQMERIQAAHPGRCPRDLDDFFAVSRGFAEESGLITPAVRRILRSCDREGVPATMVMLGQAVVAAGPDAGAVLEPFGTVHPLHVAREGPRLLEVVT